METDVIAPLGLPVTEEESPFPPRRLRVEPEHLLEVAKALKDTGFNYPVNLTAVDYRDHMDMVYHLRRIPEGEELLLKCRISGENPEVVSLCGVWQASDWLEREVYDMFGVRFLGHPQLKRILLPEGWVGHPLRKDYQETYGTWEDRDEFDLGL